MALVDTDTEHQRDDFSNFGSLKSTETGTARDEGCVPGLFQQFRLVEEH